MSNLTLNVLPCEHALWIGKLLTHTGVVWLTFNFTTCQHYDVRDEPSFDRSALNSSRDLSVMY